MTMELEQQHEGICDDRIEIFFQILRSLMLKES